jgi:cation diffusion facilitator CzcD-associated flavoprotein CzcO
MGRPSIAVIGAGLGGIAAVIALKAAGHHDILVFERADEVGGVWRANTYPGAACDVPSPFYSYSFEPNPRWPHRFARQSAILDYIKAIVDQHDVRRHIRFGAEVLRAAFDDATGMWTVELGTGESVTVDVLVSAVGQLSRPSVPRIMGFESFTGSSFHSAEWDHAVDLTGARVAVIGTGASAIQFVPAIQPQVGHLDVFQRSAPYLLPRPDREFREAQQKLFDRLPTTLLAERGTWYGVVEGLSVAWVYSNRLASVVQRISQHHMRRQTETRPGLFEKVWPDYPIGCKRILFSSDYLPALTRPNVDLVTERITKITPDGIATEDGYEHPADVIIWGTGFQATEFLAPMTVTGSNGVDLRDQWARGAHAYYGMTVPHFPNLLIMYGPNTPAAGRSSTTSRSRPAICATMWTTLTPAARRSPFVLRWRRVTTNGSRPGWRTASGRAARPGTAAPTGASPPTGRYSASSTASRRASTQRTTRRCPEVPPPPPPERQPCRGSIVRTLPGGRCE